MKRIHYLLALPLLAMACESPTSSTSEEDTTTAAAEIVIRGPKAHLPEALHPLYDAISDIHDNKAMPLYEPTVSCRMKIRGQYAEGEAYSAEDEQLIAELEVAGEQMMEWMRAFEADYEGWPEDSARSYLQRQLKSIEEINAHMQTAVAAARNRLADNDE